MNPTELPFELQFQYLLPLSYNQILNFCQVNRAAAEICRSEFFWNAKALQDFGLPLATIRAETPVEQYRILYEIETALPVENTLLFRRRPEWTNHFARLEKALLYNQPHFLTIEDWSMFSLSKETINLILSNPDRIERLENALWGLNADAEPYNRIMNLLYRKAIVKNYVQVAERLITTGVINFTNVLVHLIYTYKVDLKTLQLFETQAARHGYPDLIKDFDIEELVLQSENYVENPEVFKYLLDQTYSPEQIREIIEERATETDSFFGFLVRNYLL